jgi:hypothetical protein
VSPEIKTLPIQCPGAGRGRRCERLRFTTLFFQPSSRRGTFLLSDAIQINVALEALHGKSEQGNVPPEPRRGNSPALAVDTSMYEKRRQRFRRSKKNLPLCFDVPLREIPPGMERQERHVVIGSLLHGLYRVLLAGCEVFRAGRFHAPTPPPAVRAGLHYGKESPSPTFPKQLDFRTLR